MIAAPTITYHEFTGSRDVLRSPRQGSARERSRRAVILALLTLFIPGAAQITAGSRRLGRIALATTVACWFVLLLGAAMYFTMRTALLTALTQPFIMWLAAVLLTALAIGWFILWLDTLRLIRLGSLAPGFRPIIAVVVVVFMLLTSGGLGYAAHLLNEGRTAIAGIFSEGAAIPAEDGRYNFLLLGADSGEGREGVRPDSIHMVSVNQATAETIIFSIPRNFQNAQFSEESPMRQIYPEGYDCGNECIINFLYTEVTTEHSGLYPDAADPGAEAMMDAVSGTLDLPVHGYVMIDMGGFSELIDAMGGVTIDSGGWVPYRGPRAETGRWGDTWFAPGEQTLNGDEALSYARSRNFSSDYNRIQRQQCIQQAMITQFTPRTLLTRFAEIMEAGENLVETNLPQSQLGSLLNLAADAQEHTPQRLVLGAPDFGEAGDLFSTYPDFEQIHTRVDQLIANEEESEDEPEDDGGTQADDAGGDDADAGTDAEVGESQEGDPPGPTPDHDDDAVAEDEPTVEEAPVPTQPDGSELTVEYMQQAQDNGEVWLLEQAASTNHECTPAG